jgi:hypothetical protein
MKSKYAALWLVVAGLAFFALAASSPQCARSSDSVLNPGPASIDAPDPVQECQHDCDATARTAERAEKKRHREESKACNDDPICLALEDQRHASTLAEIETDRQGCIDNCTHQQGTGLGGQ